MNENERYMRSVAVRDVPWHRLTTPYGRASEFPRFFAVLETMRDRAAADEALYELTIHTEHQSTLWHATPFAMIFLTRIFRRALEEQERNATARDIAAQLLEHFLLIAECVHDGSEMAHADPLTRMNGAGRTTTFSPTISFTASITILIRRSCPVGAYSDRRRDRRSARGQRSWRRCCGGAEINARFAARTTRRMAGFFLMKRLQWSNQNPRGNPRGF